MTSNISESYIGKTMERSKWLAKLISNPRNIETQYGPSAVFNFITKTGKYGVFFAKNIDTAEMSEGICFHFEGTVKSHKYNEYSKKHETTFNRVKIMRILGKSLDTEE
jgi:hypothetical protein